MAIGSGLGGSFGIGMQSSYDTYATINRWREVESVSLKKNKRMCRAGGSAAARSWTAGAAASSRCSTPTGPSPSR